MRRPFSIFKLLLYPLIIALSGYGRVFAADPVVHISAKPTWISACKKYDQKPSMRTVEDGYFFQLVEHQVQVEKQEDYHHYIREIVSNAGIQNGSEISVSFDPTYERLDFHEITIWRDNKPISRLKASAFKILADEKDLSNFIYQGTYSALCILDDIRKGDRIEYSYTITGRNPIFNNRFCSSLFLQWYQVVAHQYTALIVSDQRKLNMKSFNNVSKPVIVDENGLKRYEWEDFQVKAAPYDDNEPSWYDARAWVQVSDFNNWKEVIDWALSINPTKSVIKGELAEQIAKLKAASGNDQEKYFRNAVKTVQDEVRYMGIEIGQYSHRANDPEKVFSQRYGDCKDKSLLLVSMLQADGIDANMVLINTAMEDKVDQFIPASNVFDHAVVVANLKGKQVWVDATISYQRGMGANLYFPSYGKGLVLKAGNTGLTFIPPSKTGKIVCEEKFVVKNVKSPVDFDVKTTYTLDQADRIRDRLASAGMAETERNYLKYYAKTFTDIDSRDSVVVIDDEKKNVLTTIEKYKVGDFLKKDSSGDYSADFYADCIKEQLPSITGQTKTPVDVNYPFDEDYTINVIMPTAWDIETRHNEIKRDNYEFSSNYSVSGKKLSLSYHFAYLKDYVPADKLKEFKRDIKQLTDNDLSYSISYDPNASASDSDTNIWMVNLCLLIVSILVFLGFVLYRRETPAIVFSPGASFTPIGGWLILVIISLFLTPLTILNSFADHQNFSVSLWDSYTQLNNGFSNKMLLIFETAGEMILICYAVFCLILILNRRDILPRYIIGYFSFTVLFALADYALGVNLIHKATSSSDLFVGARTLVIAAIWIGYFKGSSRVEETFIVPHPHYNYSYEGTVETTDPGMQRS